MKHPPGNLVWVLVAILVLAGWLLLLRRPAADNAAARAVAEARQALRAQGFKTDLADFDFSTPPDMRARAAVLTNTVHYQFDGSLPEHPSLLSPVGSDSAMVVWKLAALKRENRSSYDDSDQLSWDEFRRAVNQNNPLYDPACATILSGPIGFNLDASHGSAMLLPHLAVLKNLAQTLGDRTVLALHDGNPAGAWTNLLAATRLVSAYEPEPAEVSHLVRLACAVLAYNAMWQALQTNGWTDAQLARLQQEWELVDYFTNLPATVAFQRASDVAARNFERQRSIRDDYTFMEFCKMAIQYPMGIWSDLNRSWNQHAYREHGGYEDEAALLLFYRDREVELRNAVRATTWAQMRQLPGVTNEILFQSKYQSRAQALMNMHRMNRNFQREGSSFLGRTAEVEAQRRVLLTALALERYRGKHGAYPDSLAALTPEFLKTPLPDFMDGQPLRYRLGDDGHFLLYSIGLDGVDNGGKMRQHPAGPGFERPLRPDAARQEYDLVWPLPASDSEVNSVLQREQTIRQNRAEEMEEMQATAQWNFTIKRQAEVENLLAQKTQFIRPDMIYHGRSLAEMLQNLNSTGTNRLSLAELLTPHQIITGAEPETVTFEVPIAYDVVTNLGSLDFYVDPATNNDSDVGAYAMQCDFSRAANGDCLLAWSTIYECPGKHALGLGLTLNDLPSDKQDFGGSMLPFEVTNLCQFSRDCVNYDVDLGARFHARLPEPNGNFSIECVTTNGTHLKTLSGSTTNGEFNVLWDLVDDHGQKLHGETFNSIVHLTLPDSGRTQTLRGP